MFMSNNDRMFDTKLRLLQSRLNSSITHLFNKQKLILQNKLSYVCQKPRQNSHTKDWVARIYSKESSTDTSLQ